MDWNLIACARHHLTFAPDEPDLREHLHAATPAGPAWRCLRCGDFVLGPPRGSGPADDAPVPLRGQLLRDAIVLRLLAVERLLKGVVILLLSYGVYRFRAQADAIHRAFEEDLPLLEPLADRLNWNLEHSWLVLFARTILEINPAKLTWIMLGLVAYGALQLAEAVGLWLLSRWGEYLTAVATSVFIPLELYELFERITVPRVTALVVNVAAVVLLIYRKRLFGARGGRAAHDAERHHESLIRVIQLSAGRR